MKLKNLFILFCLFATSCRDKSRQLPYYNSSDFKPVWEVTNINNFHKIRPFKLTDQEGQIFTEQELNGKICVVDFFFTSCPGICPKMTANMSLIQQQLLKEKDILLISHSVMPAQDSVPVLAAYAKEHNVQYEKWKLLTGNKQEIYDLGRRFYFVEEDLGEQSDTSVFLHTENFVLIDKNRIIRGIYNGLEQSGIKALLADIKVLKEE